MPVSSEPFRPDAPIVPELAAGAVLLSETGTETLLLHHREQNRWCFPKGHVDPGESLAEAARREIQEETGLSDIHLGSEILEVSYRFYSPATQRNVLKTTVYFRAQTPKRSAHPESTFDRAEWVGLGRARELVRYDTDRQAIDAILASQTRPSGGRVR